MIGEVRVKICGITRPEDAELVDSLGAWAMGFICYSKSPRYIDAPSIRSLVHLLSKTILPVAVVVDLSKTEILRLSEVTGIRCFQLQGEETPDFCAELQAEGLEVIRAFRLKNETELDQISAYPNLKAILIDSYSPKEYGGSGIQANWEWAKKAKSYRPLSCDYSPHKPIHRHSSKHIPNSSKHLESQRSVILAGGLNSTNIGSAIAAVSPYAVDLSSGVEISPGLKDHAKLYSFFETLRELLDGKNI